jgi:hypothetical protein
MKAHPPGKTSAKGIDEGKAWRAQGFLLCLTRDPVRDIKGTVTRYLSHSNPLATALPPLSREEARLAI